MKEYLKEIIILIFQVLVFYVLPMFAGPTDIMGLVFLMLLATFVLSIAMGYFSSSRIKYCYPQIAAVLFAPTIFLYYNETALTHVIWYFVDSAVGVVLGVLLRFIAKRGED